MVAVKFVVYLVPMNNPMWFIHMLNTHGMCMLAIRWDDMADGYIGSDTTSVNPQKAEPPQNRHRS